MYEVSHLVYMNTKRMKTTILPALGLGADLCSPGRHSPSLEVTAPITTHARTRAHTHSSTA